MKSNLFDYDRGALLHRCQVIGLTPTLSHQLVGLFTSWLTNNGPEWTIKRFKSLKVDLIRQSTGLPPLTKYVRKNRSGQFWGPIGTLFRMATTSRKQFQKAVQALCIYTSKVSPVETKSQLDKFLTAISCSEPHGMSSDEVEMLVWSCLSYIGKKEISRSDNRLITYRGSNEKFAPLPHQFGKTVRQDQSILEDLRWFSTPEAQVMSYKYAELYSPVLSGIVGPQRPDPIPVYSDQPTYGGEVHFIQEPGYKLRAVASPYRIHQLALKPLGDSIGSIVSRLPWDCTFDQQRSFAIIQENIRCGRTIHSVDLSNATDYFPLDIQLLVLRTIFGQSCLDVQLFRDISRLKWYSSHGDLRWERGQPLGLYPSFYTFTLTHGLVLYMLSDWQHEQFLVVGDDVVIFDEQLYLKYIDFLNRNKCPYSPEKSIVSKVLAEFAGKIITSDSVIPQLKWRKMSNDSFLDLARILGPKSRTLMTKGQKRVFDSVKSLLPPIGLNMSKPGTDFADAFLATEEFLSCITQSYCRSLTGLTRVIHHNVMSSSRAYIVDADTRAFDEKVRSVFSKTVFSHWKWLEQISEIPRALDLWPRLPMQACPRRVSTLRRYEELLRLNKE